VHKLIFKAGFKALLISNRNTNGASQEKINQCDVAGKTIIYKREETWERVSAFISSIERPNNKQIRLRSAKVRNVILKANMD
jgi:hypothetical protein